MNKSKFAIAIDAVTSSIITFIITFFICRKFIKSAFFLFFVCILASFLAFVAIFKFFVRKFHLKNISLKEQKRLNLCLNFFKFSPIKETQNFLKNLLNASQKNDLFFENENYIFYINFRFSLSEKDFFSAFDYYNLSQLKELIFVCEKCDEDFKKLLQFYNNKFYLFNFVDFYELMKFKNNFPTKFEVSLPFSQRLKNKLKSLTSSINRKHFKNYFFSGLSLLALSFFLPFTFYYSIFGSLLLILSIACLLKSSSEKISNNKNFSLIDATKK